LEEVEVVKSDGDRDQLLFLDQRIETIAPSAQEAALLEAAARQ
jgi:hypothetical protein